MITKYCDMPFCENPAPGKFCTTHGGKPAPAALRARRAESAAEYLRRLEIQYDEHLEYRGEYRQYGFEPVSDLRISPQVVEC